MQSGVWVWAMTFERSNADRALLGLGFREISTDHPWSRELSLIGSGIADGFQQKLKHGLSERPDETVLSAMTGVGLTLAARGPVALKVPALALGAIASIGYVENAYKNVVDAVPALREAFVSDANLKNNRAVVAQTLGHMAFDTTALLVTGGITAGATRVSRSEISIPALTKDNVYFGERQITVHKRSPIARLYEKSKDSVGKVEQIRPSSEGDYSYSSGTAFSVDKSGRMITALHVVDGSLDVVVVDRKGRPHTASMIDFDRESDLALLRLDDKRSLKAFKPVRLSRTDDLPAPDNSVAIGHPEQSNALHVSPGWSDNVVAQAQKANRTAVPMHVRSGNSGGPLFDLDGSVKAVTVQGAWNPFHTYALTAPASKVSALLERNPEPESNWFARLTGRNRRATDLSETISSSQEGPIGKDTVTKLLGRDPSQALSDKGSHVKFTRVDYGDGNDILFRSAFDAERREIEVRPVAIAGQKLNADLVWSDKNQRSMKIQDARLRVRLGADYEGRSVTIENAPRDAMLPLLGAVGS